LTFFHDESIVSSSQEVTMAFMQPQVRHTTAITVETASGESSTVPFDDVGTSERSALSSHFGERVVEVTVEKDRYLARTSAPGYMDRTDWAAFPTEKEAWAHLIEFYPECFTWSVEHTADEGSGTAHIYMPSDAAAEALVEAVQSLAGSSLERDGNFVYASLLSNSEEIEEELTDAGFDVEEG